MKKRKKKAVRKRPETTKTQSIRWLPSEKRKISRWAGGNFSNFVVTAALEKVQRLERRAQQR